MKAISRDVSDRESHAAVAAAAGAGAAAGIKVSKCIAQIAFCYFFRDQKDKMKGHDNGVTGV